MAQVETGAGLRAAEVEAAAGDRRVCAAAVAGWVAEEEEAAGKGAGWLRRSSGLSARPSWSDGRTCTRGREVEQGSSGEEHPGKGPLDIHWVKAV